MAGHSKFKNIMHRKGAQDAKRAKVFTKLGREIIVATKLGGPDPTANARLRSAIQAARAGNMPKDNIERAIKKASDPGDDANYEEARYEGYGPGGIAVIVEALTDNRNRTVADVRVAFSKNGGNMGDLNAVAFNFDRMGYILVKGDGEKVFEAALEAGADDVEMGDEDMNEVWCGLDDFASVRDALEQSFGDFEESHLAWRAKAPTPIDDETQEKLVKMVEALEDLDDVQYVFTNAE